MGYLSLLSPSASSPPAPHNQQLIGPWVPNIYQLYYINVWDVEKPQHIKDFVICITKKELMYYLTKV